MKLHDYTGILQNKNNISQLLRVLLRPTAIGMQSTGLPFHHRTSMRRERRGERETSEALAQPQSAGVSHGGVLKARRGEGGKGRRRRWW